jgi:hypothetical protein
MHSAPGEPYLLRLPRLEQNCLNCHSGGVAAANIASEVRKRSGHHVELFNNRHTPVENPLTMPRHVQCVDCHNPHAVSTEIVKETGHPTLGLVSPTMRFVPGLNRFGVKVENCIFEYEVCFKCHADSITRPRREALPRQIFQTNTRLQFQVGNPSYHPIIGPRNNPNVVSLIPPWQTNSVMRCTDCHNSEQAANASALAPSGPHTSIYEPLLIANYTTKDFTTESAQAYALCYRCHSRQSILGNQSFPLHSLHIVNARAPCSACHDPHGISRTQGNSLNNSFLINFDIAIVHPATGGLGARTVFESTGPNSGNCTLTCHGVVHVRFTYGAQAGGNATKTIR